MSNRRFFYPEDGGEVGEIVSTVVGETWECPHCYSELVVGGLDGRPHEHGVEDENGDKWWLYLECPDCGHEERYSRVQDQIVEAE